MIMKKELWKIITTAIRQSDNSPRWLKEIGDMAYPNVVALPNLGNETPVGYARPYVTNKLVKADYLDFLREQIRLEPRGPEWSEILRVKLSVLQPFVGRQVLMADFYYQTHRAVLYINPETGQLFHAEHD
jgi:hypothetical protein